MKFAGLTSARLSQAAVVSRVLAAVLGGYALTYAVTAFLTLVLPLSRTEAVLTASLLSFAIYTGAIIAVFAAPSATRAWARMFVPTLAFAALAGLIRYVQ